MDVHWHQACLLDEFRPDLRDSRQVNRCTLGQFNALVLDDVLHGLTLDGLECIAKDTLASSTAVHDLEQLLLNGTPLAIVFHTSVEWFCVKGERGHICDQHPPLLGGPPCVDDDLVVLGQSQVEMRPADFHLGRMPLLDTCRLQPPHALDQHNKLTQTTATTKPEDRPQNGDHTALRKGRLDVVEILQG